MSAEADTKPVTQLDDARALKRAKLPLNLPIEHKFFTEAYTENWIVLVEAENQFLTAVRDFHQSAGSRPKWRAVKRKFKRLVAAAERSDSAKLGEDERAILDWFLIQRVEPYIRYWDGVIANIDAGMPVTISAADIPVWCDDE